jgi:hypothetical protein
MGGSRAGLRELQSPTFLSLHRIARASTNTHRADMAGPSDKARFYLEQSATELNELERKKIFTRVRRVAARKGASLTARRKRSAP